jgi:hypothetical protein
MLQQLVAYSMHMCTRPDLSFVIGLLDRYQSNPGIELWKMVKKALRYAQGTKDLMPANI